MADPPRAPPLCYPGSYIQYTMMLPRVVYSIYDDATQSRTYNTDDATESRIYNLRRCYPESYIQYTTMLLRVVYSTYDDATQSRIFNIRRCYPEWYIQYTRCYPETGLYCIPLWVASPGVHQLLLCPHHTHRIHKMILESQPPQKIVNSLFTITDQNKKLTVL